MERIDGVLWGEEGKHLAKVNGLVGYFVGPDDFQNPANWRILKSSRFQRRIVVISTTFRLFFSKCARNRGGLYHFFFFQAEVLLDGVTHTRRYVLPFFSSLDSLKNPKVTQKK